jgi:hypothetical protein
MCSEADAIVCIADRGIREYRKTRPVQCLIRYCFSISRERFSLRLQCEWKYAVLLWGEMMSVNKNGKRDRFDRGEMAVFGATYVMYV